MLVSWNWLKEYVPLTLSHAEMTDRLMMAGLNHESTEPALNDFAPGTTRNEFNLPKYYALDLRVAKTIPIAGRVAVMPIFEAYNLFNSDNINSVNTTLYGVNTTTNVLTLAAGAGFGAVYAVGRLARRVARAR
jgi:hypothetical protein